MKLALRKRPSTTLPGVQGPVRPLRRNIGTDQVHPGDVVVMDHVDLDRSTAQALVDAGVVAVLHTGTMISGRYPNRGPRVLVDAGVVVVDGVGHDAFARLKSGETVRVDAGQVHLGDEVVASGRDLDRELVDAELEQARTGMVSQLASFTHNSTEFLRREQDVFLHGEGVPQLSTRMSGRPVVIVVGSHDWKQELRGLKAFLREQRPVIVGVGEAADALAEAGLRADVVVVTASDKEQPRAKSLRRAGDVVAVVDRGTPSSAFEQYERLGVRPLRLETGATAEDAALLVAAEAGAVLIVGVGMHATLDDFLDRGRPGLASTFLTRLRLGPTLVDAAAVPHLYDGAVRPRHLLGGLLAGFVALSAAIGVTPLGQEWASELEPFATQAIDYVRGLLP